MSKERITAYLTEKANKHEISFTDLPKLTELIEGYLNYGIEPKTIEKDCNSCRYKSKDYFDEPCISCGHGYSNYKSK